MIVTIRRSQKRRTIALRVTRDGVTLHAPYGIAEEELLRWARSKQDWIERTRRHFAARVPPGYTFADGERLPYLDETLTLRLTNRTDVRRVGAVLEAPAEGTRDAVRAWYERETLAFFTPLAHEMAARLGVQVRGVKLTHAKTRWGSCTASGVLRFNPRILLGSARLAVYLCAHEVAHLRELNHSPRFWRHVAALMPSYAAARQQLKSDGWRLTFDA